MKKILIYLIILFFIVGLSGILYIFNFNQENQNFSNKNVDFQDVKNLNEEQNKTNQNETTQNKDINSSNIQNQNIETQNKQAELPEKNQKNFYSLLEVQKHNSKESCWTVIRKEVYDLTQWISKHPGGEKAILNICGKDGTDLFEKQHGGKDKPESALLQFKIGQLLE